MRTGLVVVFAGVCALLAMYYKKMENKNDANVIVVGVTADYYPFAYVKDQKVIGKEIDFLHRIMKTPQFKDKKLEIKEAAFEALPEMLESGKITCAVAALTTTEERVKKFDFSIPYYSGGMVFVCKNNSDITFNKLNGKKIAVQIGSTMASYAATKFAGAEIINSDTIPAMVELLMSDKVDYIIVDAPVGAAIAKEKDGLTSVDAPDAGSNEFGVMLPKNSPLTEDFNSAIRLVNGIDLLASDDPSAELDSEEEKVVSLMKEDENSLATDDMSGKEEAALAKTEEKLMAASNDNLASTETALVDELAQEDQIEQDQKKEKDEKVKAANQDEKNKNTSSKNKKGKKKKASV